MRLKDIFSIGRDKSPGFAITKDFYLSVLASKMPLPTVVEVLNPKGEGDALRGFGVPLRKDATKDEISSPFQRGFYALATPDQKTVLRLAVVSKEEAGFHPDPVVTSALGQSLAPETVNRIRATWTLMQITFESHHPEVYPALEFMLRIAQRLADLTEGVVADPISRQYRLPLEVIHPETTSQKIHVSDVVSVHSAMSQGELHIFTLGLMKFSLPELEMVGVEPDEAGLAELFLLGLGQSILTGKLLEVGGLVGHPSAPFRIVAGGLDRGLWEGIPCMELIPEGKAKSAAECLRTWKERTP